MRNSASEAKVKLSDGTQMTVGRRLVADLREALER